MLKKITLTIFMITCALLIRASAQTEIPTEKQNAIKELITLINTDNKAEELVQIFSAQMQETQDATVKAVLDERTDLTAADKKMLAEMLSSDRKDAGKRYADKLMQKINYTELLNEIALSVYDKYFTLEEINDLIAFYKTPTGQKTLKLMTPIAAESMRLTQERLLPKIPIIMKEIEQEDRQEIEQKINAKKPRPKRGDTE